MRVDFRRPYGFVDDVMFACAPLNGLPLRPALLVPRTQRCHHALEHGEGAHIAATRGLEACEPVCHIHAVEQYPDFEVCRDMSTRS